jgi:hypothetical protein
MSSLTWTRQLYRWPVVLILVAALLQPLGAAPSSGAEPGEGELGTSEFDEPRFLNTQPYTVMPDEPLPAFHLRAWDGPFFEEGATARLTYGFEVYDDEGQWLGYETVVVYEGPLEVRSDSLAVLHATGTFPDDIFWAKLLVTSGDELGESWLWIAAPETGSDQWLDFGDDEMVIGATEVPFRVDAAWLRAPLQELEVSRYLLEDDAGEGLFEHIPGSTVELVDAASGLVRLPAGTLRAADQISVSFLTADDVAYQGWFSVGHGHLELSPRTLPVGYQPPVTLTLSLTGGLTFAADPDPQLIGYHGTPVDGALGATQLVDPATLRVQLVAGLPQGGYDLRVATADGGTTTGYLRVAAPFLDVWPQSLVLSELDDQAPWLVVEAFQQGFDASTSVALVPRAGGAPVAPSETNTWGDDDSWSSYLQFAQQELAAGMYDLVLTTGTSTVSQAVLVREPYVQAWAWGDWDELPGPVSFSAYPAGFSVAEAADLTVRLYDRDGTELSVQDVDPSNGWGGIDFSAVADEGTHRVVITADGRSFEGKTHVGFSWLESDPEELEEGYEAPFDLELSMPGGDLGPHLWSNGFAEYRGGTLHRDLAAPQRLTRDTARQQLTTSLAEDEYWMSVTDGDVVWNNRLVVGDPYPRWGSLAPWQLDPGYAAPVTMSLVVDEPVFEAGVTTVSVLTEYDIPRSGAVGDVVVVSATELRFELLTSLPRGWYVVEAVTGTVRVRGGLSVDLVASASLTPSRVRTSQLPATLQLAVENLDLTSDEFEYWSYGPDGYADLELVVSSPTSASVSLPAGTTPGFYGLELADGERWAWVSFEIVDPRIAVSPSRLAAGSVAGTKVVVDTTGFDVDEAAQVRVLDVDGEAIPGAATQLSSPWWRRLTFTLAVELPAGDYRVEVSADGEVERARLAVRTPPATPAPLVEIEGSGSASTDPTTGEVTWRIGAFEVDDPLVIEYAASCPAGEPTAVTLDYADVLLPMEPIGGGRYRTEISESLLWQTRGGALVVIVECEYGILFEPVGRIELFDPSGFVTDADTEAPVAGAEVTLFNVPGWVPQESAEDAELPNTCQSNVTKPGEGKWNQPAPVHLGVKEPADSGRLDPATNPQLTADNGYYGWDVAAGCWYVTVQKEGYEPLVSPIVGVNAVVGEVVDLDLKLRTLDTTPPAWPTGAELTGTTTTTSLQVEWPAATDDRGGPVTYLVSFNGATPVERSSPATFTDLLPDTDHTIAVTPKDQAGNLGSTLQRVLRTKPLPPTPPTWPAGAALEVVAGTDSLVVSWPAATNTGPGVLLYSIRLGTGEPYDDDGTSWTFSGLEPDTDYAITVYAVDSVLDLPSVPLTTVARTRALAPTEPDHRTSLLTTYQTKTGWAAHLAADVLGNAQADLVSYHPSNGTWWVTESLSGGELVPPKLLTTYQTKTGWAAHLAADVLGSSKADLLSYHPSNGTWWVTESLPGGRFAAPKLLTTYQTKPD